MDAIEKRARELLAIGYEKDGLPGRAALIRDGSAYVEQPDRRALQAISLALTPPEGYVLVPEAMTDDMEIAFAEAWFSKARAIDDCEPQDAWSAALAVRPEVP